MCVCRYGQGSVCLFVEGLFDAWCVVMVSYGKGLWSRLRVGVRVRIRIRVRVRVGVRVSVRVRAEPKALSGQSLVNKIGIDSGVTK